MNVERPEPLTEAKLVALRAEVVATFDVDKFTCDACGFRHRCELVFDPYNTDGDCLAEK